MKFSIALLLAAVATTEGFAPVSSPSKTTTALFNARADTSDLIQEAMAASKKFGPASPEARLAWEAVEEVDASDNSVASKASLAEECDVDDVTRACMDYNDKMAELKSFVQAQKKSSQKLKEMVESVKQVKLSVPKAKPGEASPMLKAALAEAKKITEEKGISSPEAAVAWDNVEEISAADNSGALGGAMSADECLVDAAQEACEALEELERALGSEL